MVKKATISLDYPQNNGYVGTYLYSTTYHVRGWLRLQ